MRPALIEEISLRGHEMLDQAHKHGCGFARGESAPRALAAAAGPCTARAATRFAFGIWTVLENPRGCGWWSCIAGVALTAGAGMWSRCRASRACDTTASCFARRCISATTPRRRGATAQAPREPHRTSARAARDAPEAATGAGATLRKNARDL